MDTNGPEYGILHRYIAQDQSHQDRIGRLQEITVKESEKDRGTKHREPFAVGAKASQHVAPEQQFLENRSKEGCVQEHAEGIGAAGYLLQHRQHGAAEGIEDRFQQGDPKGIDHLRANAQTQAAPQCRQCDRRFPAEDRFPEVIASLPCVENGKANRYGQNVAPGISEKSIGIQPELWISL